MRLINKCVAEMCRTFPVGVKILLMRIARGYDNQMEEGKKVSSKGAPG